MNRIGFRLRDAHYVRSIGVCHREGGSDSFIIASFEISHLPFLGETLAMWIGITMIPPNQMENEKCQMTNDK